MLTPGAGSDRNHQTLIAIDEGLSVPVHRIDMRSRSVQKAAAIISGAVAEFAESADLEPARVVIGGRSFGGRMCSMAAADGHATAGLVLLSYPLHPPGKPEQLRTDHFDALDVPCLFVSGDRDPFATPDELERATKAIPGPVTHVWLEGARHSPKKHDAEIITAIESWLADLG